MPQRLNGADYGSRVLDEAMTSIAGGGLDPRKTSAAIQAALDALHKQAAALADAKYDHVVKCPECNAPVKLPMDPKSLAQTLAYTAKMVDASARLLEFSQGRADSRVDVRASLLEDLTDEQLDQLEAWLRANQAERRKHALDA